MRGCDQLGDVRPLSARVGLHTPNFHKYPQLSDARPLPILDAMGTMILGKCHEPRDVRSLSTLQHCLHCCTHNPRSCNELGDAQLLSTLLGFTP